MCHLIFVKFFLQILMNARPTLGSVDPVPATTLWATTPACVPLNTCKSMEETTAWVRGRDCQENTFFYPVFQTCYSADFSAFWFNRLFVFLLVLQTWERVCATVTSTTRVRTSCLSTWPRRCAAAPTMWGRLGTNRVRPVQLLPPVSVNKCTETNSKKNNQSILYQ